MDARLQPFIPGWDSHGLPIEYKVSKQLQESGKTDYTILEVREECAQFADNFKQIQSKQFSRLGVLADWENEYWTIHPDYEAEELRTLLSSSKNWYANKARLLVNSLQNCLAKQKLNIKP